MRVTVSEAGEGCCLCRRLSYAAAFSAVVLAKLCARSGEIVMAGWRMDLPLFNCSILVLVLCLQTPLSCFSLAAISDSVDGNLDYDPGNFYRSREQDMYPEASAGDSPLTRARDAGPGVRFTDPFASNGVDRPPVVVANTRNSINYETPPKQTNTKNLEQPAATKHELPGPAAHVYPDGPHRSKLPAVEKNPIEPHKDDLIGAAVRGQREEVQGDRKHDMSQLSNREFHSSPHARSYEYEEGGRSTFGDIYFVAIVAGCSVAAMCGVMGTGYGLYKLQQHNKAAADVDYPAYGVVGPITKDAGTGNSPNSSGHCSPTDPNRKLSLSPANGATGGIVPGDRKLAQNAHMYHYHHQKHQMQAAAASGSSRAAKEPRLASASDQDSEEDNDEVEYIVYECPGLAPTGEMEVKNPLFQDDSTPASPMRTPVRSSDLSPRD